MPPMSLPSELVEQARREREDAAMKPITSEIDRMVREGMGGLQKVAQGAAEQVAPFARLLQGGELTVPTLEDLTPEWMRPKPVQASLAPAAASGTPAAMPTTPQRRPLSDGSEIGDVTITQGGGRADRFSSIIARVAAEEGVPYDVLAGLIDTEDSGEDSVSPAGAAGIMQVVPGQGYDMPGEDARDPETSIRQGARAVKDKYRITGSWDEAGAAYFGYGTDAGGMDTNTYRQRYQQNRARYQQSASQGPRQTTPPQAEQVPVAQQQATGDISALYPRQDQLDDPNKWEICGPIAAMAAAAALGKPISLGEAKERAYEAGWRPGQGMAGPQSQVALMRSLGIGANAGAIDLETIKRDTDNGNVVLLSSPGGEGHYYVVQGVDQNGRLDLGNTALSLRASGGSKRWWTLDELRAIGPIGAVDTAIYVDNPKTPKPSLGVALNADPPPLPTAVSATQAPGAAPFSAPGATPWANETATGSMMLKSDGGDADAFLPGDGGTAPQQPYDPRDADAGPRELAPPTLYPAQAEDGGVRVPSRYEQTPVDQMALGDVQGPAQPAPQSQLGRYVPSYAPQAAPVAPTMPSSAANAVQSGINAGVEAYNEPFFQAAPSPARAAYIVSETMQAFGAESAKQVARSLGVTDEEWFNIFGYPISRVDVAGFAGGVAADPTNFVGLNVADPLLTVARGAVRDFAPDAVQNAGRAVGGAVREGAATLGRGLQDIGARAGEAAQGAGRYVADAWDANAARVAAHDARVAEQGSTTAGGVMGASPGPSDAGDAAVEYLPNPKPARMRAIINERPDYPGKAERLAEYADDDRWYHGTQADFDEFSVGGVKRGTTHWNSQLGVHFTSEPSTAQSFAGGLYTNRGDGGRVIAARLRIKNPKVYDFESEMSVDAVANALERGIITPADIPPTLPSIRRALANGEDPRVALSDNGGAVMQALGRKRPRVVQAYQKALLEQGHDGVIYGNMVEGTFGEKTAIALDPRTIDILDNGRAADALATPGVSPGMRGAGIGTQVATDIGNSVGGGVAGATYSAATGDDENMGRNVLAGMVGAPLLGRGMRRAGGALGTPGIGPNGRPSRPTVETLQQELDFMRSTIQKARAAGDTDLERRAIDRAWEIESALVDARNARADLEPRISSDVGRRESSLPLDEGRADAQTDAMRPIERVSPDDARDIGGPMSVPPNMAGRMNSALPFDPTSAAAGGFAGSQAEGEDEDVDPWRSVAGAAVAGIAGRAGRNAAKKVAGEAATAVKLTGSDALWKPAPEVPAEEIRLFRQTAFNLEKGRPAPEGAEVVWKDITTKGKRGKDSATVSLPYFRTSTGDDVPLPPPNRGLMGSPVNTAYNQAVAEIGGHKGMPSGRWTDSQGNRHKYDSPQEILFMSEYDRMKRSGEIRNWWRGDDNPRRELEAIPYVSTNRDKGGVREYRPDFIVEHNDGRIEVLEAKPAKVIATQEEYGIQGGKITGKMGWDVTKKAAGIIPTLADQGVSYRLVMGRDSSALVPQVPRLGNANQTAKSFSGMPGVDWRDVVELDRKLPSPEATSPGNVVADVINKTSRDAVEYAQQLKRQGLDDDERRAALFRFVRERLLPTAETLGRQEGETRPIRMAVGADAPPMTSRIGRQTLAELEEQWPDAAAVVRDTEKHGAKVRGISFEMVQGAQDTVARPRLFVDAEGDPQAIQRLAAQLGETRGEGSAVDFWYYDNQGPVGVRPLTFEAADGTTQHAFAQVQAALNAAGDGVPRLVPRYNNDGAIATIHVIGQDARGNVLPDEDVAIHMSRMRRVLDAFGIRADVGPSARAVVGNLSTGEEYANAIERSEQILGLRAVPRPVRGANAADNAGGAGRGAGASGAGSAGAEAATANGRGDLDIPDVQAGTAPRGLTSALPFDPASAAAGGYASSQAEGEDEDVDPWKTAAGVAFGGVMGNRMSPAARKALAEATEKARLAAAQRGASHGLGNVPPSAISQGALPGMDPLRNAPAPRPIGEVAADLALTPEQRTARASEALEQFPQARNWYERQAARNAARIARSGQEPVGPLRWVADLVSNVGYSAMLGPATLSVNLFTGLLGPLWNMPKETLRQGMRAAQTGNPAALREQGAMHAGAVYGLTRLGEDIIGAIREGRLPQDNPIVDVVTGRGRYASNPNYPTLSERTADPLAKLLAQATEFPGRLWSGLPDAIFGTVAMHSGQAREAAQIATNKGLSGKAWDSEIAQLLEDARAVGKGELPTSTDTQRVVDAGNDYAKRETYRDDLGKIGEAAKKVARLGDAPVLGPWASPFFTSIWNGGIRMAEKSPVAAIPSIPIKLGKTTYRTPEIKNASRFDRAYDVIVGSAVLYALSEYAKGGGVTGSGPSDPAERELLREKGWQPYSTLTTGPDGEQHYVPNRMYQLFETPLNAAGELHDMYAYRKQDATGREKFDDAARRMGQVIRQNPYAASGIVSILDAYNYGTASFAAEQLARLTPAAATTRAIGTAGDTMERTTDRGKDVEIVDEVLQRWRQSVGMREGLPEAQDAFGRPKANEQPGGWAVVPRIRRKTDAPVADVFREGRVMPGQPKAELALNDDPDLPKARLSPAERRVWDRERGALLLQAGQIVADNPNWQALPPDGKKKVLEDLMSEAGKLADEQTKAHIGPEELLRRVQAELSKKRAS